MSSGNKRKLRNYLIKRNLQFKIIFTNLIYMFLVVFITAGVILYPFVFDMYMSHDLGIQHRAAQNFLVTIKRLIPVVAIVFILVSLHQVRFTHRIFGPLRNFANTFKRLLVGDLTQKVSLREGDYMTSEKEKINHMIDGLSYLISRIRNNYEILTLALEEAINHVEDPDARKDVEKAIEFIKKEAQFVTEDLAIFKLDNEVIDKQIDVERKTETQPATTNNPQMVGVLESMKKDPD